MSDAEYLDREEHDLISRAARLTRNTPLIEENPRFSHHDINDDVNEIDEEEKELIKLAYELAVESETRKEMKASRGRIQGTIKEEIPNSVAVKFLGEHPNRFKDPSLNPEHHRPTNEEHLERLWKRFYDSPQPDLPAQELVEFEMLITRKKFIEKLSQILTKEEMDIYEMRHKKGFSTQEISTALSMSKGSIRLRIIRIYKKIASFLERDDL